MSLLTCNISIFPEDLLKIIPTMMELSPSVIYTDLSSVDLLPMSPHPPLIKVRKRMRSTGVIVNKMTRGSTNRTLSGYVRVSKAINHTLSCFGDLWPLDVTVQHELVK